MQPNALNPFDPIVVQILIPPIRFGFLRESCKLPLPERENDTSLFFRKSSQEIGAWCAIESNVCSITCAKNESCCFAILRRASLLLNLTLPGLQCDTAGRQHDLHIDGWWQVVEPLRFLNTCDLITSSATHLLQNSTIMTWMPRLLTCALREALAELSREHGRVPLFEDDLLNRSAAWLGKQLNNQLGHYGIALSESPVFSWQNEDLKRKEALDARRQQLDQSLAVAKLMQEADWQMLLMQEQHQAAKAKLVTDQSLAAAERQHRLDILHKEHLRALVVAESQLEQARQECEKSALQHALECKRIQTDTSGIKEKEQQVEALHKKTEELLERLPLVLEGIEKMQSWQQDYAGLEGARKNFQWAEWLVSPIYNLRPKLLESLGLDAFRQHFIRELQEKEAHDGKSVRVNLDRLQRRDLLCAKVNSLKVGSSLQLVINSRLSGFVTLINVGTSGKVWLQIPNVFAATAKISSGGRSLVPGSGMLPQDALDLAGLEYVEFGPPGWEHVVVLVTPEPLIDLTICKRSQPSAPMVLLTQDELKNMCLHLSALQEKVWSAGVLSFLVEG
jgi:hypothetical protein